MKDDYDECSRFLVCKMVYSECSRFLVYNYKITLKCLNPWKPQTCIKTKVFFPNQIKKLSG